MFETEINPLGIRKRLGRDGWSAPWQSEITGPVSWLFDEKEAAAPRQRRIIVSEAPAPEGSGAGSDLSNWWHASISFRDLDVMPEYGDLKLLHSVVWPQGWAYQMFAPPEHHVNIRGNALHLWGRPDGRPVLPNFGVYGSI